MLNLVTDIRQQESSYTHFKEPMPLKNDKGKPILDQNGVPKTVPFVPRSFRKKNPVRSSSFINEDQRLVEVMRETTTSTKSMKKT